MIRAGLRFIRQLVSAAILLVLIVCGAEVAVRIYEFVDHSNICSSNTTACVTDPTRLLIPSYLTNREMKPNASARVLCQDSKRDVTISINSLGLRGPEITVPKPTGVYRIVLLGDEAIFAPEIPESEHCVQQLSTLLQQRSSTRIEVINAGLPGGCALTEYLLFKQKLLALQPDLVVLHFDWSDVSEDQQLRRRTRCDQNGVPLSCPHSSLIPSTRLTQPIDDLREKFRLVDWGLTVASREWKVKLAEQTALSRDAASNPYAFLRDEHVHDNMIVQQAFEPIRDLETLSHSAQFQFAVVTSPKPWQVSSRCSTGKGVRLANGVADDAYFPNPAPFNALAQFVIGLRVQFADATAIFGHGSNAETCFLQNASRWSPEGHRRMAMLLAAFLNERIAGPWNTSLQHQPVQNITHQPRTSPAVQWASGTNPQ